MTRRSLVEKSPWHHQVFGEAQRLVAMQIQKLSINSTTRTYKGLCMRQAWSAVWNHEPGVMLSCNPRQAPSGCLRKPTAQGTLGHNVGVGASIRRTKSSIRRANAELNPVSLRVAYLAPCRHQRNERNRILVVVFSNDTRSCSFAASSIDDCFPSLSSA